MNSAVRHAGWLVLVISILVTGSQHSCAATPDKVEAGVMKLIPEIISQRADFTQTLVQTAHPWSLVMLLGAMVFVLFGIYGLTMGMASGIKQALASALKTPLLFIATLCICFPALYVLDILAGLNIPLSRMIGIILLALALQAFVICSFAPIAGFFGITSDYDFMKLLHFSLFSVCGMYSLTVLYRGLSIASRYYGSLPTGNSACFLLWMAIYAFVGIQMSWLLRPYLGEPGLPYEFIRRRTGGQSVYTALWKSMVRLSGTQAKSESLPDTPGSSPSLTT